MTSTLPAVSSFSRLVPLALAVYAVARWFDGRDGDHGPGLAWDIGHWAFLAAFVSFGYVVFVINRALYRARWRRLGVAAGSVGLVGVGLFVWVILGDLFPSVEKVYDLPDPVMNVGPLAFLVGLVVPLVTIAWHSRRVLAWLAPVSALAAFVLLAANLDLLIVAAALFGIALWRLADALLLGEESGATSGATDTNALRTRS